MKARKEGSLSTQIVFSVLLAFSASIFIVFVAFKRTNEDAIYSVEREKAQLIADTVAPMLAVDYYLNLDNKSDDILRQLMSNRNILGLRLTEGDREIRNGDTAECLRKQECFRVETVLLHPVTSQPFGKLELIYSSAHFIELAHRYTDIILAVLGGMVLLSLLFTFYIKSLLTPLLKIANVLRRYSPESSTALRLPVYKDANEIGRITSALNEMSGRVAEYAKLKDSVTHLLEEEVQKKTSQLRHLLYTDSLTGLPNRTRLTVDIKGAKQGTLVLVNIDDFKQINDFYGHTAGDHVLIELGAMLARLSDMTLYKLSADEFAFCSPTSMQRSEAEALFAAVTAQVESKVIVYKEAELGIRVTVGATFSLENGMEKADIALKAARAKRKPYVIYGESLNMEHQYQQNMQWLHRLKSAVDENRIVPFFQPVFDNETGDVHTYECLIRLIEPDGNVLGPELFLPVAKKARLYDRLTFIMFEACCSYFAGRDDRFALNLSVDDMLDEKTVGFIREQIIKYGVGGRITFEILESEGIGNYVEVADFIAMMKGMGCRFAIDDFGSGYSNFEHLLHLDIDYIKIDGSLIQNLGSNDNSRLIVEAIVGLARKRRLYCVAEYVHDATVFEAVKRLGIRCSQGFFLGEPRPDIL